MSFSKGAREWTCQGTSTFFTSVVVIPDRDFFSIHQPHLAIFIASNKFDFGHNYFSTSHTPLSMYSLRSTQRTGAPTVSGAICSS
jgi:hypothetical protein